MAVAAYKAMFVSATHERKTAFKRTRLRGRVLEIIRSSLFSSGQRALVTVRLTEFLLIFG